MHFKEFMASVNAALMGRPHGCFTGYRPLNRTQLVLVLVTLIMRSSWHSSH